MASSMQYYSITITNSISNTAPSDGFIDNQRIENYYTSLETTPGGLTLGLCQAKRRGNLRYHEIINQIELISNIWIDPNSIAADGTAKSAPTAFQFQMVGLFGDSAFTTADELNPGISLISTACITRCIARALTMTMFRQVEVFDPTPSISTPITTTSVPRFGTRIYVANSLPANAFSPSFEIGPYATSIAAANGAISVSMLF